MREEESSLSSSAPLNHCEGERGREREGEILRGLGLPPIRKAGTIADSKVVTLQGEIPWDFPLYLLTLHDIHTSWQLRQLLCTVVTAW